MYTYIIIQLLDLSACTFCWFESPWMAIVYGTESYVNPWDGADSPGVRAPACTQRWIIEAYPTNVGLETLKLHHLTTQKLLVILVFVTHTPKKKQVYQAPLQSSYVPSSIGPPSPLPSHWWAPSEIKGDRQLCQVDLMVKKDLWLKETNFPSGFIVVNGD